ncbi:hypothetical protein PVAP13_4NG230663 [Panicum virgatum]|uniref:Uncharacterized protein n=1 Tax=Panicum virgatum TaxID=38727 RepID=A0A8T0TFM6_PANVG|nr:hypothetical protein PVAP13_4NG230663 [Panicum virgatum]
MGGISRCMGDEMRRITPGSRSAASIDGSGICWRRRVRRAGTRRAWFHGRRRAWFHGRNGRHPVMAAVWGGYGGRARNRREDGENAMKKVRYTTTSSWIW